MNHNLKFGVGLRQTHFNHIETEQPIHIDFFEIISENYLNTKGRPFEIVMKLRERYPILMHGVSLSIASKEELNLTYLEKLKNLISIIEPQITSDHLCFTGLKNSNLHNLLPFAYTALNLEKISERINRVQDYLQRQFVFENLSAYFSLKNSTMSEAEFLNELCNRTGCGMLFDINNLYVNAINQKFAPEDFINQINFSHIKQFHLAGFSDFGDYIFDTHAHPVHEPVWELYKKIIAKKDNAYVLMEWDEDIPTFERLEEEALKAKYLADQVFKMSL